MTAVRNGNELWNQIFTLAFGISYIYIIIFILKIIFSRIIELFLKPVKISLFNKTWYR